MRRAWLLICLAALVGAAPAAAQRKPGPVVVRSAGYALHARGALHGKLCLTLTGPQGFETSSGCDRAPTSPFAPLLVDSGSRHYPSALAVPGNVTALTAQVGKRIKRFETVAAPGRRSRFAIFPGVGPDALLRFYDDSGALVGAVQDDFAERPGRGASVVFRARGVRVRAGRSFRLEPDPLEFDRTEPQTCLRVSVRGDASSGCTTDRELRRFGVSAQPACAPARGVLSGLVAPAARRAEILLGSGRRLRSAARPLPAGLGPGRLVAASIPRGEAVRSVALLDAAGHPLARERLGQAPTGLPCRQQVGGFGGFAIGFGDGGDGSPITTPVTVARAGGHRLLAADGRGRNLCTGADRQEALSCTVPPVDSSRPVLQRVGRSFVALLGADAAEVELRLDRGAPVRAATTAGPAYTGRYAGRVRFLAAAVPTGRFVRRAIIRDADGRRIGRGFVEPSHQRHRLRRVRPGLVLERTVFTAEGRHDAFSCLRSRHPSGLLGRIGTCSAGRRDAEIAIAVGCRPRRAVVYGVLPRGVPGVHLSLADGSTLRARVRRLRGLGRVWISAPPASARVTAATYDKRPPRRDRYGPRPAARQPLHVPPAARQCGYEDLVDPR